MTNLEAWDSTEADQWERLREAAESSVVLRLLETSCLLELAKLAPSKLDLAEFARATVEVICQFAPVTGAAITLDPEGLPPLEVAHGALAGHGFDAVEDRYRFPIVTAGRETGALGISGVPSFLEESTLFEKAAEQTATCLEALVDTERLRRQAARADAIRLASAIEGSCRENHLEELTTALLSLGAVGGVRLALEGPTFTPSLWARAGDMVEPWTDHSFQLALSHHEPDLLQARVSWRTQPAPADLHEIDEILGTLGSAVERVGQNKRLVEEAEVDPLTGVGNRRRADRALEGATALAQRGQGPAAVLALDLDHFKEINDELGHPFGDLALIAFAKMLEEMARGSDTVARTGGDEFLVICPTTDEAGARALAGRISEGTPLACAEVLPTGWRQTLSIGIALYPDGASSADELLARADEALYQVKAAGRDGIAVASHQAVPAAPAGAAKRSSLRRGRR